MKRLAALTALIVTVLSTPVQALAAASLAISPSSGNFNPGCNFTLTITVDTGGSQTDGVDAILFYDATRFTAKKINNGTIYSEYPGNIIDSQSGKIVISGSASASSPFAGSGVLATVDMSVGADAPAGAAQIKFDFDPADKTKTTDSNVAERNNVSDILGSVTDGGYTIGTGTGCLAGGAGAPQGSVATPSGSSIPDAPLKTLPQAADFNTTLVLSIVGGFLVILGLVGTAFL